MGANGIKSENRLSNQSLSQLGKGKNMKSFLKSIMFLLLAGGAMVFAGGGLEDPTGGAGITVDKNAPGPKLRGVISVELYANPLTAEPTGRMILRLTKGKEVAIFIGELPDGTDTSLPSLVQKIIAEDLKPKILDKFYGGNQSLDIKLKSVDQVGQLGSGTPIATTLTCGTASSGIPIDPSQVGLPIDELPPPADCMTFGAGSTLLMMDVELAVK
jgi:hypothetical protein